MASFLMMLTLTLTLTLTLHTLPLVAAVRPNILFVLVDDLGFRDVGYADKTFHTPTIDRLSARGIRMDSTYTPPNCGPSRTALFSGTHAYRFGLQGHGMSLGGSGHVPLSRTILPQKLKQLGYKTHLIGKWHQGFCNWAMYPTNRGFDSFYGFLAQGQDHFKHIKREEGHLPPYPYDFRFNEMPDFTVAGEYSVDIYSERARTIIREHIEEFPDNRTPFFILLSHAAIHVPNQVPQCYVNTYCQAAYPNPERRTKCGMMAAVDEGLTNIVDDLERAGILNNTLIVFTSDNGGAQNAGSSNWPLRGGKGTLWEGGIRIPSFIYSKSRTILPHTRWTWNGLFYMTDWYGTLWGFATQRGDRQLPETPDGYNMWRKLYSGSGTSFRTEFAFINEVQNHSYIRHGDWKLLIGQNSERGWYNPPVGVRETPERARSSLPHVQLFNITRDPGERQNMATVRPEVVDGLLKTLFNKYWSIWRPEVEGGEVVSNPFYDPCANGVVSPGTCPEPDHRLLTS